MHLLNKRQWQTYAVILKDGEDVFWIEHVLAKDSMSAAYQALELSEHRNCTLHDVALIHEW